MGIVLGIFSYGALGAAWVRPVTVTEHQLIKVTTDEYHRGLRLHEKALDPDLIPKHNESRMNEMRSPATPASPVE
jgi:hypothetical protein